MPPNDVVQHDLPVTKEFDFGESQPMPIPLISLPPGVELIVNPPTDAKIEPPAIDESPYCSVGKMTVRYPRMSSHGSGWVIAARAFITAGHVIYAHEQGGWIEEGIFCPRYNVGCAKQYRIKTVFTLQGWITSNDAGTDDTQYDMAACVVTENFTMDELPLMFEVNSVPALKYAAIGYPTTPNGTHQFNGERMWQSSGARQHVANGLIWAENDLTTGASGGPWCDQDRDDIVTGITAARLNQNPNLAVSPILSEGFQNLYDAVKVL